MTSFDDDDRSEDIERTAREFARIKYLNDKLKCQHLSPQLLEVLKRANATDMSSNAFRQLFTWATFANKDGTNVFPEQRTVSDITGLSVRTLERATAELKALGWQTTERMTRRGKSIAYRTIKKPEQDTSAETLEPPRAAVLKDAKKAGKREVLNRHGRREGTATDGGRRNISEDSSEYQGRRRHYDSSGSEASVTCERGETGKKPQPGYGRRKRGEVIPW
jgi:hypothetical protein